MRPRPALRGTTSPCGPDWSPEQELLALVHELAHWLAHRERIAAFALHAIFEYEAEAVEALVMARWACRIRSIDCGAAYHILRRHR